MRDVLVTALVAIVAVWIWQHGVKAVGAPSMLEI
jgi:hypothetical protein